LFFNFQKPNTKITKVDDVMEVNALKITLTPKDPNTPIEVILSIIGCFKPGEFSCRNASLIDCSYNMHFALRPVHSSFIFRIRDFCVWRYTEKIRIENIAVYLTERVTFLRHPYC